MDPYTASVLVGLFTNGLYSLILRTGDKVEGLEFREEDIHERIMRNEASFALIVEEAFQDLPPVIKTEEFYEFLDSDGVAEIVKRIYSFGFSEYNLDNLKKTEDYFCENPDSFEKVKKDFCKQLVLYFDKKKEISTLAPQLFSILVECSLESLDVMIKEEQDLSAFDYKIKFYFKTSAEKLAKYQETMLREIKTNQMLLRRLLKRIDEFRYERTSLLNRTEEFYNEITSLLMKLESKEKSSEKSHLPVNMAPDLEANFIQRDLEYNKLVEYLLNNQRDKPVAITTALRGAGGFGKTTLAKAVCYDPKITEKFSDGILWVTLGEQPSDLVSLVADLISYLDGKKEDFGSLESATATLRDRLAKKRLLIVIDDVWNSAHLEPFLHGGPYCAHLITTRNDDTLPPKTLKVPVDSMQEKEAIEMLKYGLPLENEIRFNELAERLGYWPLLLKLVNATLQYRVNELEESTGKALDFVNDGLNEEGLIAFDNKNPESRSQAVEATFAVSLKALTEDERARYHELAIFPEDINIPLKVLEKLWNKTGNCTSHRVKDLCTRLYIMSLLQTYDARDDFIKLHDVVREYLMNKQKEKLPFLHSQFLEAFKIKRWEDLPLTEIYLWRYLSYHLLGAGRDAELRKLLLDFKWQQSKLNATDVHLLLNDYDFFPEDSYKG
jgi:hypothetical protein